MTHQQSIHSHTAIRSWRGVPDTNTANIRQKSLKEWGSGLLTACKRLAIPLSNRVQTQFRFAPIIQSPTEFYPDKRSGDRFYLAFLSQAVRRRNQIPHPASAILTKPFLFAATPVAHRNNGLLACRAFTDTSK